MIDKISGLLKNKDIADWIIVEEKSSSSELFFIKDKLDINRSTDIHEFKVKIFVDFIENDTRYRGDASIEIGISDDIEEINKKVDAAIFSAGFVKNKYYDLPVNATNDYKSLEPIKNKEDLKKAYSNLYDLIFKDYGFESKINSLEIFAIEKSVRILTSKNTDVTYPMDEFSFELVTENNKHEEPVEIFNNYTLRSLNISKIEEIIKKQLLETDGRSKAIKNEKIEDVRLIISGDAVEELLNFYVLEASDSLIYQKVSRAKLDTKYIKNNPNLSLNIKMNPNLDFSVNARPVDKEGKLLSEYDLYKDGVVKNYVTEARYSYYLDIENIGTCTTYEIGAGNFDLNDLDKYEYVEVLTFSSFQIDPITGDFGGEFRLAKHVKDGKTTYITGGSISLNILEVQDRMILSSQIEERLNSRGPKAVIIEKATVN